MRIISGDKRGFKLEVPSIKDKTRPTEDRTKEAVFDIIQPVKKGAICLDLFAGTGQMGLEFLSRGAGYCVFIEKSRKVASLIERNITKVNYKDISEIVHGDFRSNLKKMKLTFDYVYIDPPFHFKYEPVAISLLKEYELLNEDASVIVESASEDEFDENIDGFDLVFKRKYKTQCIRIYKELVDENNISG